MASFFCSVWVFVFITKNRTQGTSNIVPLSYIPSLQYSNFCIKMSQYLLIPQIKC